MLRSSVCLRAVQRDIIWKCLQQHSLHWVPQLKSTSCNMVVRDKSAWGTKRKYEVRLDWKIRLCNLSFVMRNMKATWNQGVATSCGVWSCDISTGQFRECGIEGGHVKIMSTRPFWHWQLKLKSSSRTFGIHSLRNSVVLGLFLLPTLVQACADECRSGQRLDVVCSLHFANWTIANHSRLCIVFCISRQKVPGIPLRLASHPPAACAVCFYEDLNNI